MSSALSTQKISICFIIALAAILSFAGAGSAGAAQVTLAWDANADQSVTGYRVYYRTGTAGPPYEGEGLDQGASPIEIPLNSMADSQNPEFPLTGLAAGTYYFTCTAYDDNDNESGYSNEVSFTVTEDELPPEAPTDLSAVSLDANRMMLTWTAATDSGGAGLSGYRVFRNGQLIGSTEETIFMDSGLLASTSYTYTIEAYDLADNTSPLSTAVSAQTLMQSDLSLRINCGGGVYLDSAGHQWSADSGYNGGKISQTNDEITRTQDDTIFRAARWNSNSSGNLTYTFDIPNGEYHVNLYFADLYDGTAGVGLRVFDTFIEGQLQLDNLDIYAQVGHDAALIATFDTVVVDGDLVIDFVDQVENAKITGIEILSKGFSAPAPTQYRLTATAGANGSISPAGTTMVDRGESIEYNITPAAHHHVANVYVDDAPMGAMGSYSFANIDADHSIHAEFAVDTYAVTAECGADGSLSPSGTTIVAHGESLTFQITPNNHHEVADVVVNGVSLGAVSSYTFASVEHNSTISASFKADNHNVTASASANGTISPAGSTSVVCGQSATYTITPDAHYHVSDVQIDGASVGAVTTYTFNNIQDNRTISASFAIDEYVVTAIAAEHGAITPVGPVTAAYGSDLSFTITPAAGYVVEDVLIDGTSVGAIENPIVADIQSDRSISVQFAAEATHAPVFESGELVVDHEWIRVGFNNSYSDPIVVAGALSINGSDPSVVRIRNISSSGFDIRVQEWDYRDGWHMEEMVGYMVMERGTYTLADGTRIEASVFESNHTDSFGRIVFERAFNVAPVVMTTVASVNESDAVTGRMHSIDTQGFMYGMQEQEANSQSHASESIAYIAWEPSVGEIDGLSFQVGRSEDVVTQDFNAIDFSHGLTVAPTLLVDMQTADGGDPANIRWRNKTLTRVEVQIDEEQSDDTETTHTSEVVGYMLFADMETDYDRDNDGLLNSDESDTYGTNPDMVDTDMDGLDDGAELAYWQERWDADIDGDGLMNLIDPDADNDGVFDGLELEQGFDPADSNSVFRLPVFESGEVIVDQEWIRVGFKNSYTDPIVVAGAISINGRDPSVVRIRNIDPSGFDIRVQEWDYLDDWHKDEVVGYTVMERGTYTLADGTRIEASVFESNRTDSFGRVVFERAFTVAPVVMTTVASVNESDAVTGRMHSIDTQGFMYAMQEQEANSQSHAAESIAYIAWEPSMGEIDGISFHVDRTDDVITHEFHTIDFQVASSGTPNLLTDMQTADGSDCANIRWRNKTTTSVEVQIDEEQSLTDETDHTSEVIGFMVFGD
jgi:hypothetical protein